MWQLLLDSSQKVAVMSFCCWFGVCTDLVHDQADDGSATPQRLTRIPQPVGARSTSARRIVDCTRERRRMRVVQATKMLQSAPGLQLQHRAQHGARVAIHAPASSDWFGTFPKLTFKLH